MSSEILFQKCPICDGTGEIVPDKKPGHEHISVTDVRPCVVCDGECYIQVGLHMGQIESMRKELRGCYRMIDECVSLSDVMRNGLSEDLYNRATLEAKYNHTFRDIPEDEG